MQRRPQAQPPPASDEPGAASASPAEGAAEVSAGASAEIPAEVADSPPGVPVPGAGPRTSRHRVRLLARLRRASRPRRTRSQMLAAVLCGALGFALVVQVRQTQEEGLSTLRQSDLVRILDDVNERSARLDAEARALQRTRDELLSGGDSARAALEVARERARTLGILAGTLPATGPGIRLDISDPDRGVTAATLLDTLQELRDAGAEAVELNEVRVVASTAFVDAGEGVRVDGTTVRPPYRWEVIGDPQTMATALEIPGGVLDTLRRRGAAGLVTQLDEVTVESLRQLEAPEYARPAEPTPATSP